METDVRAAIDDGVLQVHVSAASWPAFVFRWPTDFVGREADLFRGIVEDFVRKAAAGPGFTPEDVEQYVRRAEAAARQNFVSDETFDQIVADGGRAALIDAVIERLNHEGVDHLRVHDHEVQVEWRNEYGAFGARADVEVTEDGEVWLSVPSTNFGGRLPIVRLGTDFVVNPSVVDPRVSAVDLILFLVGGEAQAAYWERIRHGGSGLPIGLGA